MARREIRDSSEASNTFRWLVTLGVILLLLASCIGLYLGTKKREVLGTHSVGGSFRVRPQHASAANLLEDGMQRQVIDLLSQSLIQIGDPQLAEVVRNPSTSLSFEPARSNAVHVTIDFDGFGIVYFDWSRWATIHDLSGRNDVVFYCLDRVLSQLGWEQTTD
jgi:hypothetical protein